MGVVLVPTGNARERLLTYGNEGAGKTFGFFSIMAKMPGHVKAYYLDTDDTVEPYLDGERFSRLASRIEYRVPMDFGECLEFLEEAQRSGGEDDWLVVDRVEELWEMAQSEFSDKVFGTDIDEHVLAHRQALHAAQQKNPQQRASNPFDGFTDWTVIKKRHQRAMRAVRKFPGHVYICAGEKKLIDSMEDSNTTRTYGKAGWKPAGEKNNGYLVRTVLRMQGNNPATWRFTTIKDRERDQADGKSVNDFAIDYLAQIARWKMEMREEG